MSRNKYPARHQAPPAELVLDTKQKVDVDDLSEVRERSVQKPMHGMPLIIRFATVSDGAPEWWSPRRDVYLDKFWRSEDILKGAIYSVMARNAAFKWRLDGPPRQVARCQQMFAQANLGKGWQAFMSKITLDLLCQDNGAFIEVIRPAKASTKEYGVLPAVQLGHSNGNGEVEPEWFGVGRGNALLPLADMAYELKDNPLDLPIGLAHLDAERCTRTGDPDYPVIYQDRYGVQHALNWWQVISLEDMPSPREDMNDVGYSAVSRVLATAQVLRDISRYNAEKVGGRFVRAVHITNADAQAIADVIAEADAEGDNRGLMHYMQPLVISTIDPKTVPQVATLQLASLPDGFDPEKYFRQYVASLALAMGVDYGFLAPLPGGNLGTASQSETMDRQSKGKSSRLFMQTLTHRLMYSGILPESVEFEFKEVDYQEEQARDAGRQVRAATRAAQITSGEITAQVARQMAADEGDLRPEYLDLMKEADITPDVTVDDAENPGQETISSAAMAQATPTQDATQAAPGQPGAAVPGQAPAGSAQPPKSPQQPQNGAQAQPQPSGKQPPQNGQAAPAQQAQEAKPKAAQPQAPPEEQVKPPAVAPAKPGAQPTQEAKPAQDEEQHAKPKRGKPKVATSATAKKETARSALPGPYYLAVKAQEAADLLNGSWQGERLLCSDDAAYAQREAAQIGGSVLAVYPMARRVFAPKTRAEATKALGAHPDQTGLEEELRALGYEAADLPAPGGTRSILLLYPEATIIAADEAAKARDLVVYERGAVHPEFREALETALGGLEDPANFASHTPRIWVEARAGEKQYAGGQTFEGLAEWERGNLTLFGAQQTADAYDLASVLAMYAKGGPGSGYFGHAGRPGQVGGSAPDNRPGGAGSGVQKRKLALGGLSQGALRLKVTPSNEKFRSQFAEGLDGDALARRVATLFHRNQKDLDHEDEQALLIRRSDWEALSLRKPPIQSQYGLNSGDETQHPLTRQEAQILNTIRADRLAKGEDVTAFPEVTSGDMPTHTHVAFLHKGWQDGRVAQHKLLVEQALKDGKEFVPDAVLADYPDLAAKYKPDAKPPKEADDVVPPKKEEPPKKDGGVVTPKREPTPGPVAMNLAFDPNVSAAVLGAVETTLGTIPDYQKRNVATVQLHDHAGTTFTAGGKNWSEGGNWRSSTKTVNFYNCESDKGARQIRSDSEWTLYHEFGHSVYDRWSHDAAKQVMMLRREMSEDGFYARFNPTKDYKGPGGAYGIDVNHLQPEDWEELRAKAPATYYRLRWDTAWKKGEDGVTSYSKAWAKEGGDSETFAELNKYFLGYGGGKLEIAPESNRTPGLTKSYYGITEYYRQLEDQWAAERKAAAEQPAKPQSKPRKRRGGGTNAA